MVRALFPQTMLLTVLMLQAVSSATAQMSPDQAESVRIYDVRDSLADLPALGAAPASPGPDKTSLLSVYMARNTGQTAPAATVFTELCAMVGVNDCRPLACGVYAVRTEESNHKELMRMLKEIRAVFTERYEVEIACYTAAADAPPALGAPAKLDKPLLRQCAVLVRRVATPMQSLTQYRYVSELQPVVAQSAAAYQASTSTLDDGLVLMVTVGAGPEDATGTTLRAAGELASVKLSKTAVFSTMGSAEAKLDLPSVLRRSVDTNLRIEFGKPTVIAVANGFEESQVLVVTATVRKLPDAGGDSKK